MENRTCVGTSFVGRWGYNEVGMYVCVVRMMLKGVTWNCCDGSYGVRYVHV